MRGKKAKQLRKVIYGEDLSHNERKYMLKKATGQIIDVGLRGKYQSLKKEYKKGLCSSYEHGQFINGLRTPEL